MRGSSNSAPDECTAADASLKSLLGSVFSESPSRLICMSRVGLRGMTVLSTPLAFGFSTMSMAERFAGTMSSREMNSGSSGKAESGSSEFAFPSAPSDLRCLSAS